MPSDAERDRAAGAVARIVERGGEADDVLRDVLDVLQPLFGFVAIRFVEDGDLVEGPSLGSRREPAERYPISFRGTTVAELEIGSPGNEDRAFLERVATLIAGYCLVGWDTRGERWDP